MQKFFGSSQFIFDLCEMLPGQGSSEDRCVSAFTVGLDTVGTGLASVALGLAPSALGARLGYRFANLVHSD